jgi:uncharacterized protein YndB with AHSA1/START domain
MNAKAETTVERTSDCELVITRLFNAPPRLVYEAWTTPELMMKWWMPKSVPMTFISCEIDARTGGGYRFVFGHPDFDQPMAFFGRYIEATPPSRLVWTNEEDHEGSGGVTTVTFEDLGGRTRLVMRNLHPSKESLDAEIASGATSGFDETFGQLDELLGGLGSKRRDISTVVLLVGFLASCTLYSHSIVPGGLLVTS